MDGTGYGTDGHIWGGEILLADLNDFARMGHFVYRPMPGGAAVIKEPWRMAIAYLYAACLQDGGDENMFYNKLATLPLFEMIDQEKIDIILQVIRKGKNLTMTSSLGRLFDGAASLVGLKQQVAFEGQAAMEFEMAMKQTAIPEALDTGYPFRLVEEGETYLLDKDRTILQMVNDVSKGIPVSEISFRFHMGLVRLFIHVCKKLRTRTGIFTIALSGGCFQNRFLLEVLSHYLGKAGFHVLTHSQVPTNDGGLSLGQAVIAAKR